MNILRTLRGWQIATLLALNPIHLALAQEQKTPAIPTTVELGDALTIEYKNEGKRLVCGRSAVFMRFTSDFENLQAMAYSAADGDVFVNSLIEGGSISLKLNSGKDKGTATGNMVPPGTESSASADFREKGRFLASKGFSDCEVFDAEVERIQLAEGESVTRLVQDGTETHIAVIRRTTGLRVALPEGAPPLATGGSYARTIADLDALEL